MIPLAKPIITKKMEKAVIEVLRSKKFVLGEKLKLFEKKFAKYCGVKYGIGVSSGTSALHLTLVALNIGPKDEVILPANTFASVAFAISYVGAKPIFIDIDETYTIDVESLKKAITPRTKAIIAVHQYGHPANLAVIKEEVEKNNLILIEDCSQAHGAEYNGKKVGSFGDAACFSFYPSKNLMVGGDGGMVVTNSKELGEKIKELRNYGEKRKNLHTSIGFNSKLSEIAAAIGLEQLKFLDKWNEMRRKRARIYTEALQDFVIVPVEKWGKHVYHLYVIRTKKRDKLKKYLWQHGIETGVHYALPIYKQPCYNLNYFCPNTEKFSTQILSLPMFPTLTEAEIEKITNCIKNFFIH